LVEIQNRVLHELSKSEPKFIFVYASRIDGFYSSRKRYLQPDFYIPSKKLFVEIKSRTYNCCGTTSEKIDHAARKYSTKLSLTKRLQ
jgi:hypothetical protein